MNSNQSNSGIFFLLLIVVAIIVIIFIRRKIKILKIPSVYLITGAVKTGKTLLSVHLAIKQYRRNVRKWWFKCLLCTILHRERPLKPMLYSNIKLRWQRHNPFTIKILKREVRIPEMSVVLLDEASLIADSMLFKDQEINNRLMLFVKLFGHYSHGGNLFINTQSLSDLHFSFKRCINSYCFIYSNVKYPFITLMKVREMMYSDEKNNIQNIYNDDLELSMRTLLIFNKSYKKYDRYCYSIFTDDLPFEVDYDYKILTRFDSLKADNLVTLQDFANLLEVRIHEEDR